MRVRAIFCHNCGGPKQTPSVSAYLYCDYCGFYIDWDFDRAISAKQEELPGPEYERLLVVFGPKIEATILSGDRERHTQLQREIFQAHMDSCPTSYSPRIGDPTYRSAMLDYQARSETLSAFDAEVSELYEGMCAAVSALKWEPPSQAATESLGALQSDEERTRLAPSILCQCESKSFWRLFDTYKTYAAARAAQVRSAGLWELYPDDASEYLMLKSGDSTFVQGWLSYLSKEDQARLLERTDLSGTYREVDMGTLAQRNCGHCGSVRQIPKRGARTVVCETCGYKLDVGSPVVSCRGCAAQVSPPKGVSEFSCPYCGMNIRMIGH